MTATRSILDRAIRVIELPTRARSAQQASSGR
jgi:hypothetical protein